MKIEHAAIYTGDLERMKDFYERYFDGVTGAYYHNDKTGFKSYFVSFGTGCRLEIMTAPGLKEGIGEGAFIGYSHIAFSLGSREAVDSLTARLKADGIPVVSGPRQTGDGYYESCVLDPDGNRVEITL